MVSRLESSKPVSLLSDQAHRACRVLLSTVELAEAVLQQPGASEKPLMKTLGEPIGNRPLLSSRKKGDAKGRGMLPVLALNGCHLQHPVCERIPLVGQGAMVFS